MGHTRNKSSRKKLLVKDFNDLTRELKEIGLDVYGIKYPKIKIDDDLGEQLRQHFFTVALVKTGIPLDRAIAAAKKNTSYGFKDQNTGREFNFWHYVKDLMGEMKTTRNYHYGECVIRRGMADPNEPEDLIQVFCYPYIAQGGKFAAPVLDRIFDHYGVDEIKITAKIGR